MSEYKTRIKQKRDTSANWTANDPVLLDGEIIIVDTASGSVRKKIGDGTKKYSQLPFDDEEMLAALANKCDASNAVTATLTADGWSSGQQTLIPSWVKNKNWIVSEVSGDRAIIDKSEDGKNAICSPINTKYLTVAKIVSVETKFEPYRVKVNADALNIRKGAGTNYAIAGTIKDKGVYTIVAESDGKGASKWGKLKSGVGWISLDYADKV